jgi:hypothetical protein
MPESVQKNGTETIEFKLPAGLANMNGTQATLAIIRELSETLSWVISACSKGMVIDLANDGAPPEFSVRMVANEQPDGQASHMPATKPRSRFVDDSIETLSLPTRALTVLQRERVGTVRQLVRMTDLDLRQTRNLGRSSITAIKDRLRSHGLYLGMDI